MLTTIADQIQNQLQDGSCLLITAPQTAALTASPQTAAAAALTAAPQTAAATAKTALTAGTTALKTATATGTAAALAFSAGSAILSLLIIGAIAYGSNVMVRAYID